MQNYNNFGKYRYTFVSLTCFLTILWHFGIKFYVKDGLETVGTVPAVRLVFEYYRNKLLMFE